MAKYTINDTTLTSIADAIRAKGGTSAALTPAQMAEAIAAIQAGGGGGGVEWITGTITMSSDKGVGGFEFDLSELGAPPDLFIVFYDADASLVYYNSKRLWALVQIVKSCEVTTNIMGTKYTPKGDEYLFGYYASGTTYNAPFVNKNRTSSNDVTLKTWRRIGTGSADMLAGDTYRYYAFKGLNV